MSPMLWMQARRATITLSLAAAGFGITSCTDDVLGPRSSVPSAQSTSAASTYRLTLFEDPETMNGTAINNYGKVAGTRGFCPSDCHPFIWTPTAGFRNLDGFTGTGFAVDINNSAKVLIVTQTSGGQTSPEAHSFVWGRTSGVRELPSLKGTWTQAYAMNRFGDVAGQSNSHPAFWPAGGGVVDMTPPLWQGIGFAFGLNSKGQAVGVLGIGSSTPLTGFPTPCSSCGFIWDRERGLRRLPIRSRRLQATAINDLGQVIGYFSRDGVFHAFRWQSQTGLVKLGTLGGNFAQPNAINNLGVVVGHSRVDASDVTHPFVWDEQHGMVDLGLPPGALRGSAFDINLDGVITGEVVFPGPRSAMAVWTPQ